MNDEQLQQVIDQDKDRWGGYNDFREVRDDVLATALVELNHVCFDAVNLVFEHHSSTSGMYAGWHVSVSMSCTVYLDRIQLVGTVGGTTLNAALAGMALKIRRLRKEHGWKVE